MDEHAMTLAARLATLLDHLGLPAAHFATQMPVDVAGLAAEMPGRIAGLVLVVPTRLDPEPFAALADRLLLVPGDSGATAEVAGRAHARLAGARLHALAGYQASGWSDVAAERGDEIVPLIVDFLAALPLSPPDEGTAAVAGSRDGTCAGITYRISGSGPPLVLSPFFLAASQWDPVEASLARHFTVIRIGGAHVGGVAALESRASGPSYRALLLSLAEIAQARPGDRILDVGCGSGALSRALATRLGPEARIDAVDVNAYLLAEGRTLAEAESLAGRISFAHGSAEELPFPDDTFDCALTVTVLEECDARRALAEMVRVVKPGGRVGVIVRAIDMPQWWSLDLEGTVAKKANTPPPSVSPGGVADKRLYTLMREAGLVRLVPFPQLVTLDRPDSTIWRYREDHVLSLLDDTERERWRSARREAEAATGVFQAHAMHCAVGVKPDAAT